jgi:hypothetical protein
VAVCGCSGESALGAVEDAMAEAAKHGDRSEKLSALVAEARGMIEQARAEQAERARAAAEAADAAAAVKAAAEAAAAAERLQAEEEVAAITLRMRSDALRLQEAQQRLGSSVASPAAPAPHPDESLCVVCMDAPKQYAMLPCLHMCACEACAQRIMELRPASCPVCREPIERTGRVFS